MYNKEAVLEFVEDYKVIRRSLIWGSIALLVLLAIFGPWRLTSVGGATMVPKLGTGEYYSAVISKEICLEDFLRINDKAKSRILVRSAIAFSGSIFSLNEDGYSIDGRSVKMSELWIKNAREQMPTSGEVAIPDGKILVMRTAPDKADPNNYEAYILASTSDVDRILERVIISYNPMRIGKWLRSDSDHCKSLN